MLYKGMLLPLREEAREKFSSAFDKTHKKLFSLRSEFVIGAESDTETDGS
jgi:hypothetical protein